MSAQQFSTRYVGPGPAPLLFLQRSARAIAAVGQRTTLDAVVVAPLLSAISPACAIHAGGAGRAFECCRVATGVAGLGFQRNLGSRCAQMHGCGEKAPLAGGDADLRAC